MIIVINRNMYSGPSYYIGRGSVFGNPFHLAMGRSKCVAEYKKYFYETLLNRQEVRAELEKLVAALLRKEKVILGCYCKPLSCHGDVIRAYLEECMKDIAVVEEGVRLARLHESTKNL